MSELVRLCPKPDAPTSVLLMKRPRMKSTIDLRKTVHRVRIMARLGREPLHLRHGVGLPKIWPIFAVTSDGSVAPGSFPIAPV